MSTITIERQWQCRSCVRQFDSKGKHDAHHRKEHQKIVTTHFRGYQQQRIIRSTTKKFDCLCGKKFSHIQSLQHHCKTCEGGIFTAESADDGSHHEEGMCQNTEHCDVKKGVISACELMTFQR